MSISIHKSKFFVFCGELLSHTISTEQEGPAKIHKVTFTYANGTASFDGRAWTYKLDKEEK